MAEALKRQRADHAHLPSVAAVDYPECGSLVLKRNELPAAKVDWLLASFGGCVRMGGQPVAAPGAPQAPRPPTPPTRARSPPAHISDAGARRRRPSARCKLRSSCSTRRV